METINLLHIKVVCFKPKTKNLSPNVEFFNNLVTKNKLTIVDIANATSISKYRLYNIKHGQTNFNYDDCVKLSLFFNLPKERFYDDYLNFVHGDYNQTLINLLNNNSSLFNSVINDLNYSLEYFNDLLNNKTSFAHRSHFIIFHDAILKYLH